MGARLLSRMQGADVGTVGDDREKGTATVVRGVLRKGWAMTWTQVDCYWSKYNKAGGPALKDCVEGPLVGLLIELARGGRLLIGDINDMGGGCNCCAWVDDNDRIVAYTRVYMPEGA